MHGAINLLGLFKRLRLIVRCILDHRLGLAPGIPPAACRWPAPALPGHFARPRSAWLGAERVAAQWVPGWQRAGALVRFFAPLDHHFAHPRLATPVAVIAARPDDTHRSTRPADTVRGLSQALGVEVEERFGSEGPIERVAASSRAMRGPVLVCWRHSTLPALANALMRHPAAPEQWPDDCFDLVWIIDRLDEQQPVFTQVPQRLLPHDRARGIARRVRRGDIPV